MPFGSQLARDIASDLLHDANFAEPAIILRDTEGFRNEYGEFTSGAPIETAVDIVSAPLSGQDRMALPEGIRDEDLRKFWWDGDAAALRYGETDGDRFIIGRIGSGQTRFDGATQGEAERLRDAYGVNNPEWFNGFRANSSLLIRLSGFGQVTYQYYDETDGHWLMAPTWRAMNSQRWGAFSEITGIRQDPGRE